MDNFDKIIKQKVEQFEVPYNDAHWAEMEGKLNAIRSAKIKRNIFTAAGVLAALSISTYLIMANMAVTNTSELASKSAIQHTATDFSEVTVGGNEANTLPTNPTPINSNENVSPVEQNHSAESTEDIVVRTNENKTVEVLNNNIQEINTTANETQLNADFIVYNNTICLGETVSFEAVEKTSSVSYFWDFGDGNTSTKANPKHIYKKSNTYSVALTVKNRQTGVEVKSVQNNIVTILAQPVVEFTYNETSLKHDDNKLKYPYTAFNVKAADDDYTFQWTLGNGQNLTGSSVKTIYEKAGTYPVTLLIKNANGCNSKITKDVVIKNGIDLYAPKAFNPNSNISENETFIPMALLGWDVQFEFTVLDQSGKIVYKTSDKNEPWNGRLNNNGQLLSPGIYGWKVSVYDADGVAHIHRGTINFMK